MPTATHRKTMEKHLGRKLLPNEWVHHIDRDRTNNSIENLQVVSPKEHIMIHLPDKPSLKGRRYGYCV